MLLLVFGTLLGCSELIIPYIVSLLINIASKESNSEKQLRNDIIDLKRQSQNVNMVDQFPVYAKLQRRTNSLTTQYKEKTQGRKASVQKARFILNSLFHGLIALCCLWLLWNYRSSPVTSLPVDLIWPASYLLALPSCQYGEISIMIWLFLVRTASKRIVKIIRSN